MRSIHLWLRNQHCCSYHFQFFQEKLSEILDEQTESVLEQAFKVKYNAKRMKKYVFLFSSCNILFQSHEWYTYRRVVFRSPTLMLLGVCLYSLATMLPLFAFFVFKQE